MAKVLRPRYRSRSKTAGEDQRKRWTCGEFRKLKRTWFHLDGFSARMKAVHHTKLIFHFRRLKKIRALAINCASVLGFRPIDGGHVTVSKVFSFLGLSPIKNAVYSWNLKLMNFIVALFLSQIKRCNWWHHELNITTSYSTISGTWPNKITWWQPFLHKPYTIPTSICKQHPNFRSTFIALATLVISFCGLCK